MITIFDDDFDEADHVGEVRKRPEPVQPPVKPDTPPQKPVGGINDARDAARRVLARFGRGEA